jgi:hypothetical protein
MERDRPKALLLILLTFFGVAAYGDILYHPEEIRSGSFGLVIYHNPQGFWEDRDWEVYDLFSETYRDSLRGKLWRPQSTLLPGLYVGLVAVPSTWVRGEGLLTIGEDKVQIRVGNRDYISETIPLTRSLTTIRTNRGSDRRSQSQRLQEILATFDHRDPVSLSEWQMPIRVQYRESSFFGDRRVYDYSDGTSARSIHNGHDFAVPRGTSVFAPSSGRIVLAEEWIVTGNTVILVSAPGVYQLFYHLDQLGVTQGQWVRAGDRLGTVGSTGLSTGPHLHWEVRINGVAVQGDEILGSPLLDKRPFITIMEGHFEKGR